MRRRTSTRPGCTSTPAAANGRPTTSGGACWTQLVLGAYGPRRSGTLDRSSSFAPTDRYTLTGTDRARAVARTPPTTEGARELPGEIAASALWLGRDRLPGRPGIRRLVPEGRRCRAREEVEDPVVAVSKPNVGFAVVVPVPDHGLVVRSGDPLEAQLVVERGPVLDEEDPGGCVAESDVRQPVAVEVADERLVVGPRCPLVADLVVEARAVLDEEDPCRRVPQPDVRVAVAVEITLERAVVGSSRPGVSGLIAVGRDGLGRQEVEGADAGVAQPDVCLTVPVPVSD